MLADYYLTLLYAWLVKRTDSSADLAAIELNPMWKRDVADIRLFNFRHLTSVVCFSVLFFCLSQAPDGSARAFFLAPFGFATVTFGTIVARHVLNIVVFVRGRRDSIQSRGEPRGSRSIISLAPLAVLLTLLSGAAFVPVSFLLGGLTGLIFESALRWGLMREAARSRSNANREEEPVPTRGDANL
jgi:hypothetical protein